MPTIEERALALVNEATDSDMDSIEDFSRSGILKALFNSLEDHDATLAEFEVFKRKVSDKAEVVQKLHPTAACYLSDLILPKPVDPLIEAVCSTFGADIAGPGDADKFRAALAKRGLKLVEVGK